MVIALVVCSVAYFFIASEKFPRHWVAVIGGATLIVSGVLSPLEALVRSTHPCTTPAGAVPADAG